jgi:glycosyltransferase involved in cell wall biosynthesis
MYNLHIYPSPFLNESRILREACTIERSGVFDKIELVGLLSEGLDRETRLSDKTNIFRLPGESRRGILNRYKFIRHLIWVGNVYKRYKSVPVSCINCHSLTVLPLGVLMKWVKRARLIYDTHELETESNNLHGLRKILSKVIERILIRFVDHSVFVGFEIQNWYIRTYGLRQSSVLLNCPDLVRLQPNDYFRSLFKLNAETKIFLYQGILGRGRGIESLIEAFASLPKHICLVLLGYGPFEQLARLSSSRYPNIRFHPAVPPDKLLQYTSSADFGLSLIEATSLSYEYCMPNKLFEYIMAGKPVVVSPTIEQKKFVTDNKIGVVADNCSPHAICDAVSTILNMDYKLLALTVENVREVYNWQKQEARLSAIYTQDLKLR